MDWDGGASLGATSAPAAWNPASRQGREPSQPEQTNALGVDPVWTGDAAVFWAGGATATIYDSATDEWRSIDGGDLSPRVDALTVWAEGLLLSWSGFQSQPDIAATGAADGIAWRSPTT